MRVGCDPFRLLPDRSGRLVALDERWLRVKTRSHGEGKRAVDCCLTPQSTVITTADVASANCLVAGLAEVGFLSAVVYRTAAA